MNGEPRVPTPPVLERPEGLAERLRRTLQRDTGRLAATGVPHLFLALLLTQGVSIVRRILLARILSVGDLGRMTYVMQIADLIVIAADLGVCTAVLKYAAEPVSVRRKREIYCAGLQWGTLTATFVALLYLVVALTFHLDPDRVDRVFLLMVVPYIPLSAVVKTPLVYMQACKEIRRASAYTAVTQALSLVMLVGATYRFGLAGFFVTVTLAPLSNLVILLVATRTELEWFAPTAELARRLFTFGFFSVLANAASFASSTAIVVLLHRLTGSDEAIGLFAVGLMVMNGVRLLPSALLQTAFPYLSGLMHERERFRHRIWELCVKQAVAMVVLSIGWYVFGAYVIRLLFGVRYTDTYWTSVVLVASSIPFAVSASAAQAMLVLGHVQLNFCAGLVFLGVSVVACLLLIPRFGLLGAGWATLISQTAATCFSAVAVIVLLRGEPAPGPSEPPSKDA